MEKTYDLIIIGGRQGALVCGYFLERKKWDYLILDDQEQCGGVWLHTWESLTLFSPADQNSLPWWLMPKSHHEFPTRQEVTDHLCQYEDSYDFPIERPVFVKVVKKNKKYLHPHH